MAKGWKLRVVMLGMLGMAFATSGCARLKELENINRQQAATIVSLNNEIARLSDELDMLSRSQGDLARAKTELEKRLKDSIAQGDLGVAMSRRGLVVTVLDRVLFDSGKAQIKTTAEDTLQKVASVLREQAAENLIFVEGHTDSDPIRHSGWRSNWELSTARATEVVHYFIDQASLDPGQFVASGYAEYQPVAENDNTSGKSRNRRVEIVISPQKAAAPLAGQKIDSGIASQPQSTFIK